MFTSEDAAGSFGRGATPFAADCGRPRRRDTRTPGQQNRYTTNLCTRIDTYIYIHVYIILFRTRRVNPQLPSLLTAYIGFTLRRVHPRRRSSLYRYTHI